MRNAFSFDGPLIQILNKAMGCLILNMVFLLTCLPVVTIGAALSALYYTIQKVLKNDRGYVVRSYFQCIKKNWKQTIPTGIMFVVLFLVFQSDSWILQEVAESGYDFGNAYMLFEVLKFIAIIYAIWIFGYIARFEIGMKGVLKNASLLMIRHLPTSLLLLVILLLGGFAMYLLPITAFILPVVMMWFTTVLMERVFNKYMSDEDKELEMKRNMVYK